MAINRGAYELVTLTLPSTHQIRYRVPFIPPPPFPRLPIAPGPYVGSVTFTVSRWLRPGAVYGIHRVAFNNDGARLFCTDVTVPIKG